MRGKDASLALIDQIVGTKILIAGNHDSCWAGIRDGWKSRDLCLAAEFGAVLDFAITTLPPARLQAPATRVLLSHLPYADDSQGEDRYAQFRLRDEESQSCADTSTSRSASGARRRDVGASTSPSTEWEYASVSAETLV